MKKKDFLKEISTLSKNDLAAKVRENSEEQMKLRFRKASGQLQDSARIKQLRRQRARLLTRKNALTAEKQAAQ